jgi:transcriptional regulator with XRE-family HTH domain
MDKDTKEVIARAELPLLFRNIRRALGLSQEKMAELSGISRVQISYYETADTVPTMATFYKWQSAVIKEIQRLRKNKWGANAINKDVSMPNKEVEK